MDDAAFAAKNAQPPVKVLLVDDDAASVQAVCEALLRHPDGVAVETCPSALAAQDRIACTNYDVVVSDIKMPGMDDLARLARTRRLRPHTPTLLVTWHDERDLAVQALRGGAYDFIHKPINPDSFLAAVDRALQLRRLDRQVEEQKQALERHAAALERTVAELQESEKRARGLNEEFHQKVVEVEAANKELEAFSYAVSHDLRAPLRAINGFSRILLEDFAAQLPEEARYYLDLVRDSAQQMGRLIDDLLNFSRLSRHPLQKQPVALADLVQQALEDLRHEHEGRRVRVTVGDLPPCQADPALLRQVFVNLLANALKYTRRREEAVIEVGHRHDPESPEGAYFLKDNGVGFDMQYAHKLFGVFQRLHRSEDYEGTGVGLATVQRIIHRHGGRVWAEAEVNRGATFSFTLGKGPADD